MTSASGVAVAGICGIGPVGELEPRRALGPWDIRARTAESGHNILRMRTSRMTRGVFCTKRLLIALAAATCLIFAVSNGSARAQVSPASASTYYVSPGGSDASAGTEEAPFRTIQRAASLVGA